MRPKYPKKLGYVH